MLWLCELLASGKCQCHSLLFMYSVIVDNVGSPRVTGDDEEDDTDDLENEFNYNDVDKTDSKQIIEEMLHNHMSYGRDGDVVVTPMQPQYPLLTNGHLVRLLFACMHNKPLMRGITSILRPNYKRQCTFVGSPRN